MKKYHFQLNVRKERLEQVSHSRSKPKPRFPTKELFILLIIILSGLLFFSCSSEKEDEQSGYEIPVEHSNHIYVRYGDDRIEYLSPVDSIPYLVDIEHDIRLSLGENLEIIRADGNRVTKKNQTALLDFQFQGFDRVIHHRDYVGILTGNRVMIPVYKQYQTAYFAYGLIIFSIIYFVSFFSVTIFFKRKFKLLFTNGWEESGSLNLYLGQLFLFVTFILFLMMVILALIFGISHEFANFVALVFLYAMGTIAPIGIILWIGSNFHSSERVIISLIILGIIGFLLWYFADVSKYIFYVTLIPAFLGMILGFIAFSIKAQRENKKKLSEFEQGLMM